MSEYHRVVERHSDASDDAAMKKRILITFLWFYAAWYAGAIIADVFSISALLGPVLGVAAAAVVAGRYAGRSRSETVLAN